LDSWLAKLDTGDKIDLSGSIGDAINGTPAAITVASDIASSRRAVGSSELLLFLMIDCCSPIH
jgi:hypothetical protein